MVLMNLLCAGRNKDADVGNRLVDTAGKEMVRQIERSIDIYTIPCKIREGVGLFYSTGAF